MVVPPVQILPSLLSADLGRLADEIASIEDAGADRLHVDVMDGHFVPNLTFGPAVVAAIARAARRPLDVHLMVSEPSRFAERFVEAGAELLTVHVEAEPSAVAEIRRLGVRAGVSLSPRTPIESVRPLLDRVDQVLVMSVEPGFGGQRFLPEVLPKVEALRSWGWERDLQIDGGIDEETIASAAGAGANVFVSGSALFGSSDRRSCIARMRRRAAAALEARAAR